MEAPFIPKNKILRDLFDRLYSNEIHEKKTAEEISNFLGDFVMLVWFNEDAKNECIQQSWYPYKAMVDHLENNKKTFVQMDFFDSMCFELYSYIYH